MQKMSTIHPWFYALLLTMLVLFLHFIPQNSFTQEKYIRFERLGQEQQLPPSTTMCIFQDSKGLIWVGGFAGLTRYDGNDAVVYNYDPKDSFSISDNKVQGITEDEKGNLWVGTQNGLNCFDRVSEKFYRYYADAKYGSEKNLNIEEVFADKNGFIWIITSDLKLNRFSILKRKLVQIVGTKATKKYFTDNNVYSFYMDNQGVIWFGTDDGLMSYSCKNQLFTSYSLKFSFQNSEEIGPIVSIDADSKGTLWLGTKKPLISFDPNTGSFQRHSFTDQPSGDPFYLFKVQNDQMLLGYNHDGLTQHDLRTNRTVYYHHDPQEPSSISHNTINCISKDNSGMIWIGTFKGVCLFNPQSEQFKKIKLRSSTFIKDALWLRTFYELTAGQLLLWGDRGLETLDWNNNTKTKFPYQPAQNNAAWMTGVTCFFKDNKNRLWMGTTFGGLFVLNLDTKKITHYQNDPTDANSLSSNAVRDIIQDKNGNIWVANFYDGFCRFIEETHTFKNYYRNDLGNRLARNLYIGRKGELWVGTRGGLNKYDYKKDTFTRYRHDPKNPNSMSESTAFDIYEDENNIIWIGTYGGGLNKFNQRTNKFTHYTTKNGLIDNTVFCALPDKKGNLWLSTYRGIVKFNPKTEKFTNYTQKDGLLNEGYDAFSYYQSPYTGHLFFEGPQGLDIFHPDSIRPDLVVPNVVFTDFLLSNKSVNIKREDKRTNGEFMLPESISTIKKIVLPYRFKILGFKYAATHYANPEKNQFAYKLENFDNDWQYVGNQRQATFTNLAPGKYTFRVKASNADGVWNEKDSSIHIVITPPWWRTWWAYILYALTITGIIVSIFRYQQARWRLQAQLQLEQREAERLKEVDALKSSLYTNITHEFRTPLTVILGANDQIRTAPEKWLEQGTAMIQRNGQQLLDLINQMLDLSKLETGKMNSSLIQGDAVAFLRYIFDSFNSLAASKALEMHFLAKKESIVMDYDPEKLLRIMNNLLSNAIKFTPPAGQIYLQVDQVADLGGAMEIKLRDTGIGIAENQLLHIFDRFYQVDDSATRGTEGTGIGLALVREMVKHLEGTLVVESELGLGTVFSIQLPIHNEAKFLDPPPISWLELNNPEPVVVEGGQSDKPVVLIIEDNPDVVQYLQACLADQYQVLVAKNGEEGIQKAIEMVPDAIISDVMMPLKDGFVVTAELKEHEMTSHIPIVLLTAKADVESRIQGLRRGADDYLAKPFNKEELLVRVENLIATRLKLQKRYASITQLPEPSKDINIQKEDEFIQKLRQVLEQNYTEAEFKSPQFQRAMGMGRTQLHNKLKALTNLSTTEVINQFRVQKGRVLLETTSMNVSEVAYAVGYNDPKYFSERYFEVFKMRPSEIVNKR